MKKGLVIVAVLLLAFGLVACGESSGSAPKGIQQEVYDLGKQALQVLDKYNSADISADEAKERIRAIQNDLNLVSKSDDTIENLTKSTISAILTNFIGDLSFGRSGSDAADKLREELK